MRASLVPESKGGTTDAPQMHQEPHKIRSGRDGRLPSHSDVSDRLAVMPNSVASKLVCETHREMRGELPVLTWPALKDQGLDAFVTTRVGGTSAGPYDSLNLGLYVGDREEDVVTNRVRVAEALDVDLDDLVFCEQVHGSGVRIVRDTDRGRGARSLASAVPAADALVTMTPGVVLVVIVADCVPLVLHDPVAGVLACVHAGWRGTVQGVTQAAIATMKSVGSSPSDVVAGIGPAIHPERFQVGAEVVAAAEAAFGDRTPDIVRTAGHGTWTFDLWRAAVLQLLEAGVTEQRIHLAAVGTGPGSDFFSHRTEGVCGRFALVARLTEGVA